MFVCVCTFLEDHREPDTSCLLSDEDSTGSDAEREREQRVVLNFRTKCLSGTFTFQGVKPDEAPS